MVGGHPTPVNDEATFMGHAVHLQWRLHDRIARQSPKLGEIVAFRNVVPSIPLDTAVDELSIQGAGRPISATGWCTSRRRLSTTAGPLRCGDFLRQRRRIYAGHLRIRDQQDYAAPTMSSWRISRALGGSGSFSTPRALTWSVGTIAPRARSPARLGTTTWCVAGSSTSGRYRRRPSETSRLGRAVERPTERPRLPHRQLSTSSSSSSVSMRARHLTRRVTRSDQADVWGHGDRLDPPERDDRRAGRLRPRDGRAERPKSSTSSRPRHPCLRVIASPRQDRRRPIDTRAGARRRAGGGHRELVELSPTHAARRRAARCSRRHRAARDFQSTIGAGTLTCATCASCDAPAARHWLRIGLRPAAGVAPHSSPAVPLEPSTSSRQEGCSP